MSDVQIDFSDIRAKLANQEGPAYWRSIDQLAETEEFKLFLQREFPRQAAPIEGSFERRDFLKLLGASMALAGLSACARPPLAHEKIVPYVKQPEQITPGRPLYFATAVTYAGYAEGVLAESHQGRPTKLEGNPDHPASLGATGAITQAQVLTLYDPDRAQEVLQRGQPSTWADFTSALADALAGLPGGDGFALLTENVTSPTLASQISDFLGQYPQARWFQYDPVHPDNVVAGARQAFGQDATPVYDFRAADVVVALDADFMDSGPGSLAHARAFADARRLRRATDTMNRLYAFETSPTHAASLADHRVALKPSDVAALAAALAASVGASAPAAQRPAAVSQALFDALVEDLEANRGKSLVVVGQDQPPVVHAIGHALNAALGNVGTTVSYLQPAAARPAVHREELAELVGLMNGGSVEALVIIDANPVYTAPASLDFAGALAKVPFSARLGLYDDETAAAVTWSLPESHFLEAWGDARAFDGTVTIRQPLILPFYAGKSDVELLGALLGNPSTAGYDVVRNYWRANVTGSFDDFWRESVYRGTVAGSRSQPATVSAAPVTGALPTAASIELKLVLDDSLQDGRFANNGWLQELPKAFSNLTWDNAALMAPATAEALGVQTGDVVKLTSGGKDLSAPVWVQPGHAAGAITLALGYGRSRAGKVGTGVGVNAYQLLDHTAAGAQPVTVAKTNDSHSLVSTQTHHSLEGTGEARHIVRSGTLAEFRAAPEHPHFVHPVAHHEADLYPDFEYKGYKWGMVIDQTVCTGCNACVVACQSENNIPIVGKAQVARGREMHWIRVDNYYSGSLDDPQFFHQPMPCQQCEKAPCEPVCPVGATVHDSEGLNVMVYNRCVGTRYCSNNCPYKVRRFNWLQYAELATDATPLSLANNPDVTVRSRGVMEKCTYCTQRIATARIDASVEDRKIRDGEVVTACQSACPTQAIVFGDLNDPTSQVAAVKASPLNYWMLEELQTFPRTTYLAKVKNPNPALGSAEGSH
ncbi:MAG: TAT-variant-translocated molybdopterin oxidoreductase [Trueperaceae bacterium]|nr:TAT-variant-translocated molybdopterin oxidoreductase [Trueperaceae bacterium]MCC6312155.1 TAT-variant-translocated molybdopterin oxidoreductase [Trueperaceae bacterium]MCO5172810.1 TAT-variant-translocated molybdopterin oxidoreductase [Trueperaceae bacterium]MCW5819936.1 TAT-variant-translocated molybdopterin oxidoreductase [Trueperaceae bacterium]